MGREDGRILRIGPLRHRIALQAGSGTQGGYGNIPLTFSTYATVWASVEPLNGRELLNAQQIHAETTVRVRLRYLSTVTNKNRIVFDSRTFEILSVIDNKSQKYRLELLCKEIEVVA